MQPNLFIRRQTLVGIGVVPSATNITPFTPDTPLLIAADAPVGFGAPDRRYVGTWPAPALVVPGAGGVPANYDAGINIGIKGAAVTNADFALNLVPFGLVSASHFIGNLCRTQVFGTPLNGWAPNAIEATPIMMAPLSNLRYQMGLSLQGEDLSIRGLPTGDTVQTSLGTGFSTRYGISRVTNGIYPNAMLATLDANEGNPISVIGVDTLLGCPFPAAVPASNIWAGDWELDKYVVGAATSDVIFGLFVDPNKVSNDQSVNTDLYIVVPASLGYVFSDPLGGFAPVVLRKNGAKPTNGGYVIPLAALRNGPVQLVIGNTTLLNEGRAAGGSDEAPVATQTLITVSLNPLFHDQINFPDVSGIATSGNCGY